MAAATRLIVPNAYRGRNLCAVRCSPLFKFRVFGGFVQDGQKLGNIAGKSRFWGRKAPTDRFPAQIFIVLPSRRPVAAIIGNIRGITRFFARNSSFSFAVAPPHIHFYRISEFERHGSGDPTPCGGYPGTDCSGQSFRKLSEFPQAALEFFPS